MLKFDARAAKLLAAGDHLTWPDAPGLRMQATASRRTWSYRYKSPTDGRMRQVKIGNWPAVSAGQAYAEWERMRSDRDSGIDLSAERSTARRAARAVVPTAAATGHPTVRELCDAFVRHYAAGRRKAKGLAELQRMFRADLGPVADLVAADLTRTDAYDLIHGMADRPVMASNMRGELGGVWDWALDSGRLPDSTPNWWRLILRGKLKSAGKLKGGQHQGVQKRFLTAEEVGVVLRQAAFLTPLIRDLLTLYLWTGARGSEICWMEGCEVEREADGGWWWTIPRQKLKVADHPLAGDLRVPLVGRALAIVRARKELYGAGYLFPSTRGNAGQPWVAQKVVGVAVWHHRPDCKSRSTESRMRWSIPDWSPHDLRRTVRTQLAALGCPSDVAEAVLGHIRSDIEGVYNRHGYDAERREWLCALDVAWERAAAQE